MLLIFTDLDGTLLNQDDYDYRAALPQIEQLKRDRIPVIPVTSKTRQEVEQLRQEIGLTDPFIVENGSGIFISKGDNRFASSEGEPWGTYTLVRLGCTYAEARQGLQTVATALGQELQGFGDLSAAEVAQLTGLSDEEAKRAKAREFTEPFITPKQVTAAQIQQGVEAHGFRVVVGDRFSHLIGAGSGKGKAVQHLIEAYRAAGATRITTIGLGNSPNDLDMLERVSLPIVIPGPGGPHRELANRGWQVASAPGCQGWANAVAEICDRGRI